MLPGVLCHSFYVFVMATVQRDPGLVDFERNRQSQSLFMQGCGGELFRFESANWASGLAELRDLDLGGVGFAMSGV